MNPKKLARKVLPKSFVPFIEESYRSSRLWLVQALYGFPARKARVIAVTGTNGKTTTCVLINDMLKAASYRTALFTTAVIEIDGQRSINTIHRTVPLTADLMSLLRQARKKQVDFVVLETTSQALHQHKLTAIPVEVAVMTNISQDHLDYHKTMEAYAAAKARLFNSYMRPKYCILNRDDDWYGYYAGQSVGAVTGYGKHKGSDLRISGIKLMANGSRFELKNKGALKINIKLAGLFNVYNAAAAAAVGQVLGLSAKSIAAGLSSVEGVPGRMQPVRAGQPFEVIVDYAHAPDALSNVLQALRPVTKGRVMIVFGATGDRDAGKRPIMGQVAAEFADRIFLTDDETYTEDPASIRQAVWQGIKEAGGEGKTTEIGDRLEAIGAAFAEAKKDDTVILTGLGHQDTRNMGGKLEPWYEPEVAQQLLSMPRKNK